MTLAEILTGPKDDRTHEAARARVPMTAANVRRFIAELERKNRNRCARRTMAQLAIDHGTARGTISPEGIALYRAYLATFD